MTLALIAAVMLSTAGAAPVRYAVVVGSNRAGEGQQELRFAGDDASRLRDVLVELGGYEPHNVMMLQDPGPVEVLEALDGVRADLADHADRGEDSVFLFYYSGHARAQALNLGPRELELGALRDELATLPSTVTLIVLDACQTGAMTDVKGVEPAADFSYNSVADLSSEGLVVLASSAADELSQESAELEGSFFTHHLVAALRGGADADADGTVTLGEAYHYAYNRTLVSTAATAVGEQHVTLQTDLRGRGELVLTRPGQATARLEFPEGLDASVLLHRDDVVVAEVLKTAGSVLTLALLPGAYEAIVREGEETSACTLELQDHATTSFDQARCRRIRTQDGLAKGGDPARLERWMLEVGVGALVPRTTAYVDRLADFGFEQPVSLWDDEAPLVGALSISAAIHRHFAVVGTWGSLDHDFWERDLLAQADSDEADSQSFWYGVRRYGLYGRGMLPLLRGSVVPYAQAGGGPTVARTHWEDPADDLRESFVRLHLAAGGGLHVMFSRRWRHLGAFAMVEAIYGPALPNLVGDVHDGGGVLTSFGLRAGF